MPQEFQVLQCYKCDTFQVHQVKKSTKWNCKLCGEKQSVKKVFGRGSGFDCRQHVQKLNLLRAELDNKEPVVDQQNWVPDFSENSNGEQIQSNIEQKTLGEAEGAKWNKYLEEVDDRGDFSDDDEMYTTDRNRFDGFQKQAKRSNKRKRSEITGRMDKEEVNSCAAVNIEKTSQNESKAKMFHQNFRNDTLFRRPEKNQNTYNMNSVNLDSRNGSDFQKTSDLKSGIDLQQENQCASLPIYKNISVNERISQKKTKLETIQSKGSSSTTSKWGHFIDNENESSSEESDVDQENLYVTTNPEELSQSDMSSQENEQMFPRSNNFVQGQSQFVSYVRENPVELPESEMSPQEKEQIPPKSKCFDQKRCQYVPHQSGNPLTYTDQNTNLDKQSHQYCERGNNSYKQSNQDCERGNNSYKQSKQDCERGDNSCKHCDMGDNSDKQSHQNCDRGDNSESFPKRQIINLKHFQNLTSAKDTGNTLFKVGDLDDTDLDFDI